MNNIATIDDPVIAICINEQFPFCRNASDLYNCTRGLWHVDRKRGGRVRYAFAVYKGVIKEVYEVVEWAPGSQSKSDWWVEKLKSQGRIISPAKNEGRSEFTGNVAPAHIREKYVDKLMPVRHTQNPIRYFNCPG
jgi:hypothetical protein